MAVSVHAISRGGLELFSVGRAASDQAHPSRCRTWNGRATRRACCARATEARPPSLTPATSSPMGSTSCTLRARQGRSGMARAAPRVLHPVATAHCGASIRPPRYQPPLLTRPGSTDRPFRPSERPEPPAGRRHVQRRGVHPRGGHRILSDESLRPTPHWVGPLTGARPSAPRPYRSRAWCRALYPSACCPSTPASSTHTHARAWALSHAVAGAAPRTSLPCY